MELGDAVELFLGTYENQETIRKYQRELDEMLSELGQTRDVDAVTPADLIAYINKLRKRDYAAATLYGRIKTIKRVFKFWTDFEIIEKSPARNIPNPRPPRKLDVEKAATDTEQDKILRAAFGSTRNYLAIRLLIETGCRGIGIQNMRIPNVDLEHRSILVTEKYDHEYVVYISDETCRAMREWLLKRPKCDHDYVFCTIGKKPKQWKSRAIRQMIRRVCEKAGVRVMGTHAHRHKKGFDFVRNGVHQVVAAAALGHKDPSTTLGYYLHSNAEMVEDAVRETHRQLENRQGGRVENLDDYRQNRRKQS